MNFNISGNVAEWADKLRAKGAEAPLIVKKGVVDATTILFVASRDAMSRLIYNVPIPSVKRFRQRIASGKNKGGWRQFAKGKAVAAWRRTSTLLRNERFYFRGSGLELEGIVDNSTPYAFPRHELNRPSRIDGKVRRAPWRAEASKEKGNEAIATFRDAMKALEN